MIQAFNSFMANGGDGVISVAANIIQVKFLKFAH
jgi:dihydrodipicolinate synthase/N-acetylneuraminate lyase